MTRSLNQGLVLVVLAASGACMAQRQSDAASGAPAGPNQLSAKERNDGWRLLFDGSTTAGWREFRGTTMPAGWFVRDGVLMKEAPTKDIITVDQFGDFELSLEWKIARGGNAGLFYRSTEEYDKVYWSATEYQLLDDPNARDGRSRLTSTGANYGLYPAPEGALKPAGEWNTTRVVAKGTHVEHWLNGTKLLEYDYGSADWEAKVKASKFAAWPKYGRSTAGHVAIQGDHAGELALRNVKIRPL